MLITAELLCSAIIALNIGGSVERAEYACTHTPQIIEVSEEMGFRPELFVSLIHHESMWNPGAVSENNACGLTQVLPKYTGGQPYPLGIGGKKLSCDQLKDPQNSIVAGAHALRYWLYQYGRGHERVGLCGYNAGFRCYDISSDDTGMIYASRVIRTANRIRNHMLLIQ